MKRALLVTAAVSLALAISLAFVGRPECWPPAETPPRQGEATQPEDAARHSPVALGRLVREPQNTWSNLAFVFGGAVLVTTAASRLARGLGLTLIAVGIGSFLYHASASRELRHLDVAAMYWVFLAIAVLSLTILVPGCRRWFETRNSWVLALTFAGGVGLAVFRNVRVLGFKPFAIEIATGAAAAVMIAALALVARRQRTFGRLIGIVVLFALGIFCQLGDRPGGVFFSPDTLIQAHAAWHVLAAAAFVLAVRMLDGSAAPEPALNRGAASPVPRSSPSSPSQSLRDP